MKIWVALSESSPINLENNMKRISKTAGLMGLLGIAVMSSASSNT